MIKKLLMAVSLLLLSNCDTMPYPWEVLASTNNCLGPFYVRKNIGKLNSQVLKMDEQELKYLFMHPWSYTFDGGYYMNGPLFDSKKDFCDSFGGIHTTFEWADEFPCDVPNGECWGLTTFTDGIYLEYSARAWAHELIHVYESQHGVFNTSEHPNWDQKGYYYFNDVLWDSIMFPNAMFPPDGGNTTPPVDPQLNTLIRPSL